MCVTGGDMAGANADMQAIGPVCSSGQWCWQNPLPQGNDLKAVWSSAPNSTWAVGESGTILYYNGAGWSVQTSNTQQNLTGVWGSAANNIWAVT
jgi:hypothetical protein